MSIRVVLVLGMFLLAAALAHGGIYAAGHDFVMNRFTGWYQFVPSEGEEEVHTPIDGRASVRRCLDVPGTRG